MKKIIVANWKMCGTPESAKAWVREFLADYAKNRKNTVIVCPPAPLLTLLKWLFGSADIHVGGQDCHTQESGAYTGETSAKLLKDVGCEYVIVGHSERRCHAHENDEMVRAKATQAMKSGLIPIICIGETLEQRKNGKTLTVISQQIEGSIPSYAKEGDFILAYEPVWAIGSGNLPTMDEIKQVHSAIISNVSKRMAIDITQVCVLYGGSVKPENAAEILALPEVSGVLVGGASLKADDFLKIVASV